MKNRRALSSVVGTVFAIIALGTTIGYVTYSMGVLEKFNEDTLVRNIQAVDTNQEDFGVVKASISNNKFNITVQNSGNIPINITRLWIKNSTATNWVYKYDLNTQVSPGGTTSNIGQSLALTALGTKSYDVKLITQRGNTEEFLINSPYSAPLQLQLYAIPDTLPGEFTTTLILAVTNNMSNKNTILNITPVTDLEQVSGNAIANKNSGPTPSSYDSLASGDTAYFKYVYEMNGAGGETKLFRASLQNGYPGNYAEASVVIQDVTFSLQSGTSLESQGLSTNVVPQTVLVFHKETQDAADGRQMYAGTAETPTVLDTSQTQTFYFYTRNDTNADVDVDPGKWNATLRMISKPVPDFNPALASPKLIYLFDESTSTTTIDSSGNSRTMTLGTAPNNNPAAGVSYGMNGTVGYHFDGGDYMEGPAISSGIDDIAGQPDTTTGWFKTTSTSDAKKVIFRVGSGTIEYYEIAVADGSVGSHGKVFFKYSTTSGSTSPQGTCTSSAGYDDGNWHHFAAVRDGDFTCTLYIDGQPDGVDTTVCGGCIGGGANIVGPAASDKATIGRNPNGPGDYFIGDLDQIFHWNDAKLTLHQVQALKNANYGANAHTFNFKLERTNSAGSTVYEILKDDPAYLIPFFDGKGSTANSAYSTNQRNYTTGSLGSFKFTAVGAGHDTQYGDRLKLTITRNAATSLNMTIKIDEPAMTNPVSSFLQTPHTDEPWPSYYIYQISGAKPQINVYNQGPYASWITYLTRLTWDDISSTDSYASFVTDACGTSMSGNAENIRQDGPLIKVGQQCLIKFTQPRNAPNAAETSGTVIPPGQYKVNVFMSGYDDTGRIFLRTTYIGIIRAIP